MKKDVVRSLLLPLIAIPLGGLLTMVLTLVVYGLLYNLLESLFYPNDPLSFPAGPFRMTFAIVLVILYYFLLHANSSDLVKAILLTGPLAAVIITVGHALYEHPGISITAMSITIAACGLLLHFSKKPWVYYYSGAISAAVALAYAWPSA